MNSIFSRQLLSICVFVTFIGHSHAQVAAVTFQFEATVGQPNTVSPFDVPFDLPFSYTEGDSLRGTLSINPVDVASDSTMLVQPLDVSWLINGFQFATSRYQIVVRDNFVADDGIPGPYDEIEIECSPLTGARATCQPIALGTEQQVLWSFSLGLSGDVTVLDGADIPAGVETWNAFNFGKGLVMTFHETSGPGMMRLSSTVAAFYFVPESSSLALLFTGAATTLVLNRRW